MRITLTIDDDVAAAIEARRRDGESLRWVINTLLREGLRSGRQASRPRKYHTKPHKLRMRAGLDPVRLNQLVDELEMDA
ncbi:MAG: antitoxin [Acidobacteria bacterium]|nr:antitoxin [Acidobacteriota bacterium]